MCIYYRFFCFYCRKFMFNLFKDCSDLCPYLDLEVVYVHDTHCSGKDRED